MLPHMAELKRKVASNSSSSVIRRAGILCLLVVMTTGVASAAGGAAPDIPYDAILSFFDLIVGLIIVGALLNAGVGTLQYMFAGTNVERSSAGKKRIMQTVVALIIALILKGAVTFAGDAISEETGVDNPLG